MRIAIALGAVLALASSAWADCPGAVTGAIATAFPKSKVVGCKLEREKGHDQYEVRVTKADGGTAEVDVAPGGKILQIEEPIAIDRVPAAVVKAFAAKYPRAKIDRAEKQTAGASESYELAFGRKEATFTADGKFVEEE